MNNNEIENELLALATAHKLLEILLKQPHRIKLLRRGIYLDGNRISGKTLTNVLFLLESRTAKSLRNVSTKFIESRIDLPTWQDKFYKQIYTSNLYSASLVTGSLDNSRNNRRFILAVNNQRQYINNFAEDLQKKNLSQAKILWRTDLYRHSVFTTNSSVEKAVKLMQGFTEAKRDRRALESCNGCIGISRKGWMPIIDLPEQGTQECRFRCRCVTKYR